MLKNSDTEGFFKTGDSENLHYKFWISDRVNPVREPRSFTPLENSSPTGRAVCADSGIKPSSAFSNGVKAQILIVHGLGEHIGRYENTTKHLALRGWTVCGFDLRGHGLSSGRRGDVDNFSKFLSDIKEFYSFIKRFFEGRVFILGHSFGGLLTLLYSTRFPDGISGAVISNPILKFKMRIPPYKLALGNLLKGIYPSLSFSNGIKAEYLSRDEEIVRAYKEDSLVHDRISARLFFQMLREIETLKASTEHFKTPLLLLLSGNDRIIDSEESKIFFDKIKFEDKKLIELKDFYHEPFNEIGKEGVFDCIDSWINPHL